jgi:hypothetical protein
MEFHRFLAEKYEGRTAWTRRTLQDEKKARKIEQDEEVLIRSLNLTRSGSMALETPNGRIKINVAFNLERPITLEFFEKELLDLLWLEGPEVRYEANKAAYGTRIADAIRDHKVLPDMNQRTAYLSWGTPSEITGVVKRALDEEWHYDNLNLKKARIVFRSGKVAQVAGENIQDTESARRRQNARQR